jgi:RHS repeat-associated protein
LQYDKIINTNIKKVSCNLKKMGCKKLTYGEELPTLKVVKGFSFLDGNSCAGAYRYGFNGHEKDDEVKGSTGTSYDFGFRMYDPRIGRAPSIDPFKKISPNQSPYAWAGSSPRKFIDYNGGFRLDPAVAAQYPHLEVVLNAISDLVENSTDAQLLANPIVQNFLGVAPGFNPGYAKTALRHFKNIYTNGKGPFVSISAPNGVVNGNSGVTSGDGLDVFINSELLDAAEGVAVNSKSKFRLLNHDQVAAMLALYETLLHEGIHVRAKALGIDENKEGIE